MTKLIQTLGDGAAVLGVLSCVAAGLARLMHFWVVAGLSINALFELGIALMVFGCFAKLHALTALTTAVSQRK